jgi:hypothetical protein
MRLRKRWRILLGLLALIVMAPPGLLIVEHFRGAIGLSRYRAKLVQQGVKLSPADMVSTNAAADNGVPQLLSAVGELRAGKVLPDAAPPCMASVESGRAVVGFREVEWVERLDHSVHTNNWDMVAVDLETNAAGLAEIREALRKPVLETRLDFSLAPNTSMTHLPVPRRLTRWFGGALQLALQDGRNAEAVGCLTAELQLLRWLGADRIAISELVRMAVAQIILNQVWEILQADGWNDDQLKAVQEAWQSQDMAGDVVRALEGELVFGEVSTKSAMDSNEAAYQMIFGLGEYLDSESERPAWERLASSLPGGDLLVKFCKREVYCRLWRFAWADQAEQRYLTGAMRLIEISRQAAREKSFAGVEPALDKLVADSQPKGIYNRLRFPGPDSISSLSRVVEKGMKVETVKSLAIAAIAIKRYSLAHGQPPSSLRELVPAYLPAVPIDFMDGEPVRYRRDADGTFTLYSVGDDHQDNGGDPSLPADKSKSSNRWNRKDYVWPTPATEAELEAFRKNSASD